MKKITIFVIFIFFIVSAVFIFEKKLFNKSPREPINICFAVDDNYVEPLLVEIYSIFKNNKSRSSFHFYIFIKDLKVENKNILKQYIENNLSDVDFIPVDPNKISRGKNLYDKTYEWISDIVLSKLLMPSLLPLSLHKCLYLDSDIIVCEDIKKLYDINIDNYILGMVLDWFANKELVYFNGGVILFNLDKWRNENIDNKIKNFIESEEIKKIILGEQDIINGALHKRIKIIDKKYNLCFILEGKKYRNLKPYIIHYAGSDKPWKDFKDPLYESYKKGLEEELEIIKSLEK